MNRVRLVVVTGLSGSGKSSALRALEDLGFFCVDNLPARLLVRFLELSVLAGGEIHKVAVGMDLREPHFLEDYRQAFQEAERLGIRTEVLYLEASDEVLVRRFSETRRRHPLARDGSLAEGIARERRLFQEIKGAADRVIDTSGMNVHDLKRAVWSYFRAGPEDRTLQVNLLSFGYRYGIPHEADILLDVRFLPNPYFVPALKGRTGREAAVQDHVLSSEQAQEFLRRFLDLLEYLVPLYEQEGKTSLTVAIGCTGGKHRSVSLVEELGRRLRAEGRAVRVLHRDVER
ncbi:MAG: RNase adapter RapZ [Deltaproteobacteria bacterium]|nr:RNase adapter RapZ [Deltaproteobacteria bacterium]